MTTTTAVKSLELLVDNLTFQVGYLTKSIQKWLNDQSEANNKAGTSVAYGFAWAEEVISNSVQKEVLETILAWAEGPSFEGMSDEEAEAEAASRLKMVAQECLKKALEGARSPCRSTSDMSRVVETRRTEYWAQQVSGWNSRLAKFL